MTTRQSPARTLQPAVDRRHAGWRTDFDDVLGAARRPAPGLWERWAAIRYLEGPFLAELRFERAVAEALADALTAVERDRLWTGGELLELSVRHLRETIGRPDDARAFQRALDRLERALGGWCREYAGTLGRLDPALLPEPVREAFDRPHVQPLAATS